LATFSESTFYRITQNLAVPAIDFVYNLHRESWSDKIREMAKDDGFHLIGDGQYDSRGYSALICKYVLMDLSTKLIVNFSIKHKKIEGGKITLYLCE